MLKGALGPRVDFYSGLGELTMLKYLPGEYIFRIYFFDGTVFTFAPNLRKVSPIG
jgi:hypothetical protein